jgi:DNA-binding PadR family transcriptional regulator
MTATSAKELFVLGRVSRTPTHGHDIMRTLKTSRADLWVDLSEKHVYYVLRKLERGGLVFAVEERAGNLPARKVYGITDAGRLVLAEALRSERLVSATPYSDFDVVFGMLCYTDALSDEEKTEVLRRRRGALVDLLEGTGQAQHPVESIGRGRLPDAMLSKVRAIALAEIEWLEGVMVEVRHEGWASMRPTQDSREAAV